MVSSNSLDEKQSWLIARKPVAMLHFALLIMCSSHDYWQWLRQTSDNVGSLNHDNLIYPILCFYNILELNFHDFYNILELNFHDFYRNIHNTQNTNFENILLGKRFLWVKDFVFYIV